MNQIIDNFFNIAVLQETYPLLLAGLFTTVKLSLIVIPIGLLSGLSLALLGNSIKLRLFQALLIVYVDFFRAFPPLVLLIFVYYALPMLGIEISSLGAVVIAFMLNTSAYYSEILRAGLESISRGQYEASRSTGLSAFQTLVLVIVPQAVRNVLPDLVSNTLEVLKLTALASVVAFPELLHEARSAQGYTYNPSPLIAAALIYLALLWPMVRLLSRFEHRMGNSIS